MISWWMAILLGIGVGLLLLILIIPVMTMIKNTKERIKAKRDIKNGRFLIPLDKADYNVEMWKDKINAEENAEELKKLNEKIFKVKNEQKISQSENI